MKIFLTGSNGYIGKILLKKLIQSPEVDFIIAPLRAPHFLEMKKLFPSEKVQFYITDFSNESITRDKYFASLISECDRLFHLAGLYDLKASYTECYHVNCTGLQNILFLAQNMPKLKAMYLVSTFAVCGFYEGLFTESNLNIISPFKDSYSKSKLAAELIFNNFKFNRDVSKITLRPGVVVGPGLNGKIEKYDGPYIFMKKLYEMRKYLVKFPYLPIPFNPKAHLPLIPVCTLTDWMSSLLQQPLPIPEKKTYHLLSSECASMEEFIGSFLKFIGLEAPIINLNKNSLSKLLTAIFKVPKEQTPFLFNKCQVENSNLVKDVPNTENFTFNDISHDFFTQFIHQEQSKT